MRFNMPPTAHNSLQSTLAEALGAELDLPVYYEEVSENKYLADFYKDQKKYVR